MQMFRFGLVAIAAAFLAVAPAHAQRVQVQPKGILIRGGETPLLTAEAIEKLKLTAEQKDKYAKIEGEFKDKSKTAQDKYLEDVKLVRGERDKIKEANDKLQADKKKVREDQLAKVEPILTADQKTVFAQVKGQQAQPNIGVRPIQPAGGIGGVGQVLPPGVQQRLNLTDDQKKQIADIQKEVDAKIQKVLTDDQKKQLEDMKKGPLRIQPRPVQPAPAIRNIRQPQAAPQPAVEPRKQN